MVRLRCHGCVKSGAGLSVTKHENRLCVLYEDTGGSLPSENPQNAVCNEEDKELRARDAPKIHRGMADPPPDLAGNK